MATTVEDRQKQQSDNPLLATLTDLSADEPVDEGAFEGLALLLVEALLALDDEALQPATAELRRLYGARAGSDDAAAAEEAGRFAALLSVASWGLDRLAPQAIVRRLEPGSHLHRFLEAAAGKAGITNSELAEQLKLDRTEVSRVGRRAGEAGLAAKRRFGRLKRWEVTPRGRQALSLIGTDAATVEEPELAAAAERGAAILIGALPDLEPEPYCLLDVAKKAAADVVGELQLAASPDELTPHVIRRAVVDLHGFEKALFGGGQLVSEHDFPSMLIGIVGAEQPVGMAAKGGHRSAKARGRGKRWWVKPADKGWLVMRDGNRQPSMRASTKADAVSRARQLARKNRGQLVISAANGRIAERVDYGVSAAKSAAK